MPHLVEMQNKYAESGVFTVVIAYVGRLDEKGRKYLREEAPQIPAYDRLNPPGSPCGNGVPDAYLFDHTGALVKHDHPTRLIDLVPGLVAKAPLPPPPGILGDFEPVTLKAEAELLQDASRPVLKTIQRLKSLADSSAENAQEAKDLRAQVLEWFSSEVEHLQKAMKKLPGNCAYTVQRHRVRFKGVDKGLEQSLATFEKNLLRVPNIRRFITALEDIERARQCEDADKGLRFRKRGINTLKSVAKGKRSSKVLT